VSTAHNPSWSPDGKRLVFDDGRRIAIIDADGRNVRYLTNRRWGYTDPTWPPDGRWIAFVRHHTKRPSGASWPGDVWLMNASGGHQRLLIRNATQPAWKP